VSDSKKRDDPLQHSGVTQKKGPMPENHDDLEVPKMSRISKTSKTSKKFDVAKESKSGTNREGKKSSSTLRGDFPENAPSGLF
jgi:hypothetical protein